MRPRGITVMGYLFCLAGAGAALCGLAVLAAANPDTDPLAIIVMQPGVTGLLIQMDYFPDDVAPAGRACAVWGLVMGLGFCAAGVGLLGLNPAGRTLALVLLGIELANSHVSALCMALVVVRAAIDEPPGYSEVFVLTVGFALYAVVFGGRIIIPALCMALLALPGANRAFALRRGPAGEIGSKH